MENVCFKRGGTSLCFAFAFLKFSWKLFASTRKTRACGKRMRNTSQHKRIVYGPLHILTKSYIFILGFDYHHHHHPQNLFLFSAWKQIYGKEPAATHKLMYCCAGSMVVVERWFCCGFFFFIFSLYLFFYNVVCKKQIYTIT